MLSIGLFNQSRLASIVAIGVCCFALSSVALSSTASAQEPAETSAPFGAFNPANWKVPEFKMPSLKSLLPSNDEKQRLTEKKDSLFGEVGNSVKNSWTKTKEAFSPAKLNPFKLASSKTEKKTESKPGFFSSLFAPPEPKPAESVTEFLSQDRIAP